MLYSLAEEFNETRKQDNNIQHCLKKSIEQKEKEKLVIACSNTVYNPNTMMIHLKNTSLTHRTMMATRRLNIPAFGTVT